MRTLLNRETNDHYGKPRQNPKWKIRTDFQMPPRKQVLPSEQFHLMGATHQLYCTKLNINETDQSNLLLICFAYICITGDSTVSAFWATSVQCWCWDEGEALKATISTALMRPRRPKQYCLQLDIGLWCKNQIEHSIWDESLLFCKCACSLEYSSLSTLAGLSYHVCGKLEVAFKVSLSSQHQHCTDEAQKAETVSALVTFCLFFSAVPGCLPFSIREALWPSFQKMCIGTQALQMYYRLSWKTLTLIKS